MHSSAGLVGEFYQLVLAATYHADGLWGEATFDLYARGLPDGWGYYVAAGLEPVLQSLEGLSFAAHEVAELRAHPVFAKVPGAFFDALTYLRFTGDVDAVAEGTPVFPNEPILRITAPLWVGTLVETRLIQLLGASSSVASRAARMVDAAGGRPVLDFGSRRASSGEASLIAARAAYIGGVGATTNALAAMRLGVPPFGTMSDTFLAAYGDERLAYDAFRLHFPWLGHFTLPDDDPVDAVRRFRRFKDAVSIVRVDSADLDRASRAVRAALDAEGMQRTRILGSGQLDELAIYELVSAASPIQMFAVGRALAPTPDPGLRFTFRLAELVRGNQREPITRAGASQWPGRKQVLRFEDYDMVCLDTEASAWSRHAAPLLRPIMRRGARLDAAESLALSRDRRSTMVGACPAALRDLRQPSLREVRVSDGLAALALR